MSSTQHFTSADLETLPDDGKRYEIIDGDLVVSRQPHFYHQRVCFNAGALLEEWSDKAGGGMVNVAPGVIFDEDDDVAPDVVWVSSSRLAATLLPDGKLHGAPELVIEVLSAGAINEQRDRESKLKLYSRRGVDEYWIIDWRTRSMEVYRRQGGRLTLVGTFFDDESFESPLLAGFVCHVADLFKGVPLHG
jgi:Uma2 family endonuclease